MVPDTKMILSQRLPALAIIMLAARIAFKHSPSLLDVVKASTLMSFSISKVGIHSLHYLVIKYSDSAVLGCLSLVLAQGFEPQLPEPKSGVLPLDDARV